MFNTPEIILPSLYSFFSSRSEFDSIRKTLGSVSVPISPLEAMRHHSTARARHQDVVVIRNARQRPSDCLPKPLGQGKVDNTFLRSLLDLEVEGVYKRDMS